MRVVDLIHKKKQGHNLTAEEIRFLVAGYTAGNIPDYQMAALLMAICLKGMNKQETAALTLAYVDSGAQIDLAKIKGVKVDKHSTGGVGDKVSLIIIPLLALAGVIVAKMSGRGLGHTGGTIDKLESITGFKTELSQEEFIHQVNIYHMAIAGQSANLTPADKRIYALRDVTATVDSVPLIAASVMSKKIASGADAVVLDVKVGSGAFMKSLSAARELAEAMVEIGKSLARKTIAVITDMSQPLGNEVGNANEVREVIEVLSGRGAPDLNVISLTIAAHMAVLGGAFPSFDQAYCRLEKLIGSGQALEKFKQLVAIQGGNPSFITHPEKLPQAQYHIPVRATAAGYVEAINTEAVGIAAMQLGAGRQEKDAPITHAAGLTIHKKNGAKVSPGDILGVLHTNLADCAEAANMLKNAYSFSPTAPEPIQYIHAIIQ